MQSAASSLVVEHYQAKLSAFHNFTVVFMLEQPTRPRRVRMLDDLVW
jgi:hypothetical protein